MAPTARNVTEGTEQEWTTKVEPFPATWDFESNAVLQGVFESKKELEQDALDGGKRMVWVYTIRTSDGEKHGVWGSYNIDQGMQDLEPGTEVRITYEGTVKIDNGARSVKQFVIQTRN